ncbi:hypothetical protein [Methanosphaera stadtmanae]|uniref:hypothetical protein n=1 Tax=Methanosphaera stadtmanae TaxID=2317 RepID=UPI002665D352|nr:hypothetical protein [Methanosphaera stadtmanae]
MKHTIHVNNKNLAEHIIHLDQHLPINIKPLPHTIAYKIQDTPIITTTTQTLQKETITSLRQKSKQITTPTHLIIIKNGYDYNIKLQTGIIQENPQITIHHTTPENMIQTLHEILTQLTPQTEKPVTTNKHTLYHNNTPIKTYQNKEYLQHIQTILNTNPLLTLQEAEYQAQKQYYKHISYDKTNHLYKLTLNQKTTSTHTKLTNPIQEKNTQTNNTEQEEETLCQKQDTPLEPLPPTPWNNRLHHMTKEHTKYQTTKKTTHNNPDTITHLEKQNTDKTTILNTQKPDRNLTQTKNTYTLLKKQDKKLTKYYKTHDKTQARYIRDKLEQHNYNKTIIPTYEQQYKKEKEQYKKTYTKKYQTIDYYQRVTTKLYTNSTTKEAYQQHKIKTS